MVIYNGLEKNNQGGEEERGWGNIHYTTLVVVGGCVG